jgi:hypothetical protein
LANWPGISLWAKGLRVRHGGRCLAKWPISASSHGQLRPSPCGPRAPWRVGGLAPVRAVRLCRPSVCARRSSPPRGGALGGLADSPCRLPTAPPHPDHPLPAIRPTLVRPVFWPPPCAGCVSGGNAIHSHPGRI